MTNNINKIILLLISLIVIFAMIGWIFSYDSFKIQGSPQNPIIDNSNKQSETKLITFIRNKSVKSKNKIIVTDKFVGKLEKDAQIIAISSNGDAYNVRSGVLITDGMVIKSTNEVYSIDRINDPKKSVSSN